MVRLSSIGQINKILLDEAKSFTHAFNPSTWDVEAGRSECKARLVYRLSSWTAKATQRN